MFILISGISILNYLNNMQFFLDYFMSHLLIGIFILLLVVFIPMSILFMASLFAPALVLNWNLKPIDAIKKSLDACLINSTAFFIHGAWFILFSILATLTLGLGFFILLPITQLTIYFAYLDIFKTNEGNLLL
jgi:uncharacterized membrane protein